MTIKQHQFVSTVQAAMIVTHCSDHYSVDPDIGPMSSIITGIDDAYHAAMNIPEGMTACEAACEFLEFWRAHPDERSKFLKHWFARF